MTTAPEPRHPAERLEQPMDVLEDALECSVLTPEEHKDYRERMGNALLWEAIETVRILDGDPAETTPASRLSREERRAALRRRRVLVHALLIVAVTTLLTSLYALGLGHEAVGWFGLAGTLGLCWMAHRAEEAA